MEYSSSFKFLSLQEIERKNTENLKENEKTFLKINLLDQDMNPCSFMIFGDKKDKVINLGLTNLIDVIITYKINYSNNKWNVSFVDMDIR